MQAGGGWRRREREWSCNARARSKEGALGRCCLTSATESSSSASGGIQGASGCRAGAGSCRSEGWGGFSGCQQKWGRWVQSQAAGQAAWQAGSKCKARWESWDMMTGAMSFRKGERGKQKMKKRQVGSDCAISAQFPCRMVPCMCFVLFVCCPTCVLIPAAQGRLGVKVVCVCFRNSTRKELTEQWSHGSGISYLLT